MIRFIVCFLFFAEVLIANKSISFSNDAFDKTYVYNPVNTSTAFKLNLPDEISSNTNVNKSDCEKSKGMNTHQTLPKDIPLTIIPSFQDTMPLAIFISGDGGWTSFDQSVSEELAKSGIPVVGIDAQKYFWEKKEVQQTTADVSQVVSYYLEQWKRKSFILIGFSFGASVSPFVANRFQIPLKNSLKEVIVISPDEKGDFEIHISDMLNFGSSQNNYDVIAEIRKSKGIKFLCVFAKEESESTRKKFIPTDIEIITLPGNHHYDNNYKLVANTIIKSVHNY